MTAIAQRGSKLLAQGIVLAELSVGNSGAYAAEPLDTLRTTDIEEIVVVSTPKENTRLRQQPLSATALSQTELSERSIDGMKSLSANVPNLFIPAYGSRLTTSVYIRGIGSRTGTPAVALYVDGVPQVSPAGYDFNFACVDRIDVLRGPQSTLYGRNSMGGVIRVFTKNPMHYQGTDITLTGALLPSGYSSAGSVAGGFPVRPSGSGRLNLTHYHRVSDRFAFSAHLFGFYDGGYFRNEARANELIDSQTDIGARMRFVIKPTDDLDFDITASHEWLDQGGYPYEYRGVTGSPTTPDPTLPAGHIAYDNSSGYRRHLTNVGLTTEKRWTHATLTSVTGFQHLSDQMDLDQDFTDRNLYTLMQRQNVNTVSEEIIIKKPQIVNHEIVNSKSLNSKSSNSPTEIVNSKSLNSKSSNSPTEIVNSKSLNSKYSWLFGLSAIRQWNTTEGPVTFHDEGLAWLNGIINHQANSHLPTITSHDAEGNEQYTMNFIFDNQVLGTQLAFPGTYKVPTANCAIFHQSTLDNLFGVKSLSLTAGLRLDYEHFVLDHDAHYSFSQRYGLDGRLTYPDGSVREGMTLVPQRTFNVEDALRGSLSKSYLQLLPKFTLQWSPNSLNHEPLNLFKPLNLKVIYASVSRGYRSGGYNIQMFSDLLQSRMQTAIMQNVAAATIPVVESVSIMPSDAKARVRDILTSMSEQSDTDVDAATWYKPESSWNYEVGTHMDLFAGRLQADLSAFWMDTRNQQISKMSSGGLGRVTVNNGSSRSLGCEAALRLRATDQLHLQAAYGFTHATFNDQSSDSKSSARPEGTLDPSRNHQIIYVPFVPRHTLYVGATQTWNPTHAPSWLDAITLHADYRGAGLIYWDEANTSSQSFAGTLNARLTFNLRHSSFVTCHSSFIKSFALSFYSNNILSTRYQTFYFETMQRGFAQYSRPIELGLELRVKL